jgi:hypothetical protein
MNGAQKARHESLLRVQRCLDDFDEFLGDVNRSPARSALDRLAGEVTQLAGYQRLAPTEVQSRAVQREDLREALRLEQMRPIAAIARLRLADSPLIIRLQVPRKNVDDATLIAAGDGMAKAAAQYRDVFIAQHLPADFVEQLEAAVNALRKSVEDREGTRVQRRYTTRAILACLSEASHMVRILDGLVMRQIRKDPALLAGWTTAVRHRGRPGGAGTASVPQP